MKTCIMVAALATGILFSCQRRQENFKAQDISFNNISSPSESSGLVYTGEEETRTPDQPKQDPSAKGPVPIPVDYSKQIIRNAKISFEVKNARSVSAAVNEAVRASGGYIASANEVQLAGEIKHEMTIRVPREKFDELLTRISGYADTLLQKKVSSEDVTAEYIDTKARISAKEKVKERYYDFLKQAKNIEEVLKVQSEIGSLQEDIEVASGRVNYIRHRAAFSTIILSFFEQLPVTVEQPQAPGFWKEIAMACMEGWEMIRIVMVGLVKIWPVWLAAILLWGLLKRRKSVLRTANHKID
ncbi:MAG: DUF4349 domain-containing protein [Chitinophagaceae bacterium]|nr:DUF4349 domain-containing protein [Chitinophagaceae bacterium]